MTMRRTAARASGVGRHRAESALGLWGIGLMLVGGLSSCDKLLGNNSSQCEQSVNTVRQAVSFKDFPLARQWREYAWKVCDERAVFATLDKEIIDAEARAATETAQAAKKAQQLAQKRINAAQALWRQFDAQEASKRTPEALDATAESAKRLERGLTPAYAQKLQAYNDSEKQKRLAALPR
jgi:hypothetical protein